MRRVTSGMALVGGMISLASCAELVGIEEWDPSGPASSTSGGMGGAGGSGESSSSVSTTVSASASSTGGSGGTGGAPPAPCDSIPATGLHVCWVYGSAPVPANEFVGLAGGEADPDQGQTIQNEFLDPMCVNPTPGEPFVLCDLGTPDPNWDIQFRAGRHLTPGTGTSAGTWDCSDTSCSGEVYVYSNGVLIGSLINDVPMGVVSTLPHFNPPGLLNVKVTVP